MRTGLVLPAYNAGRYVPALLEAYERQSRKVDDFIVIDSSSTDSTAEQFRLGGVRVHTIAKEAFNHGGTRNLGVELLSDCDVIVFITQDALLADEYSLSRLLEAFDDPSVGIAYGRQLPRDGAGLIEAHARLFNYPAVGEIRGSEDIPVRGFKTAFTSNSFAAYRVSALREAGGFPTDVILGEDFYAAARILAKNWKIAYVADSSVKHSHGYGVLEEGRRYFDIGVFHASNSWLFALLGRAGGEGLRFVKSELGFLLKHNPLLIPEALARTASKLLFYKLGLSYEMLPSFLRRMLSMHGFYWDKDR